MTLKSIRQSAFTVATRPSVTAHDSNSWAVLPSNHRSSLKPGEPQLLAEKKLPLLRQSNPLRIVPVREVTI